MATSGKVKCFNLLTIPKGYPVQLEAHGVCWVTDDLTEIYQSEERLKQEHEDSSVRTSDLLQQVCKALGVAPDEPMKTDREGGKKDDPKSTRYYRLVEAMIEPIIARRKAALMRTDVPGLVKELLAYWRAKHDRWGALVRCYHQFPLMPNWGTQALGADGPPKPVNNKQYQQNQTAYNSLLNVRYQLDKARILADVLRRREKLKVRMQMAQHGKVLHGFACSQSYVSGWC